MKTFSRSAFGLRAPLCQFLANVKQPQPITPLSDERAHSQLTNIDTWADITALTRVTRSPITVFFSTPQNRETIAHTFSKWRTEGKPV